MIEQTLEKMRKMKLYGMLRSFKHATHTQSMAGLTADELIHLLVENEWDERQNRSMERSLRNARFRYKATVEGLDFHPDRMLDKNQLLRLADGGYIKKGENILLTGSTGTGKSYLACALGNQACAQGHKVLYANTNRLLTQLKMAKAEGSSIKEMIKLEKQDVLILDDFGIQPLDVQGRMLLMEIIEDRHGKKSTIITSQLPVNAWYEVIGDQTLADAILDRIVHDAHRLELQGDSLRKKRKINQANL
ncbi:IS21-like element helper ATPase IstB [Algoriphagus aestuariicola]|uniref:IS21-like element helper ATPase IstB n=1 Tax=Algoriphagus aestuariicola TaxID=1852016 RepID=A0ABS3BPH3_9BACT|nr:IS21-like element helper ATPase IstB [Algoriphagus aestuariicola]MBN7800235.1 IS21-like element helper ATPase IstB [Algoriphagus aestuariicola]